MTMKIEQDMAQEMRDAIAGIDEATAGIVRVFNKVYQQTEQVKSIQFGCEWCERKSFQMKVEYDARGRHIRTTEISYCPFCGRRLKV